MAPFFENHSYSLQPATNRERELNGHLATQDNGIAALSHYQYRAPEPPHILIPPTSQDEEIVMPTFDSLGGDELTEADLQTITQSDFKPIDNSALWKYEHRRHVQKILPFLYLGPWEALRTQQDFIRSEGISLLVAVRSKITAKAGIMDPKRAAEGLGILYDSLDVQDNQELITVFPRAVKIINDHLINCYRQQVYAAGGNFVPGQSSFRMGKIFVFCESGNERSAAVVAAYVLAMYKITLVQAIQFIQAQRFCVGYDEPMKNLLRSYEDILSAQRDVREAQRQVREARKQSIAQPPSRAFGSQMDINMTGSANGAKRGRSSFIEDDEMSVDDGRFEGRSSFQPFM